MHQFRQLGLRVQQLCASQPAHYLSALSSATVYNPTPCSVEGAADALRFFCTEVTPPALPAVVLSQHTSSGTSRHFDSDLQSELLQCISNPGTTYSASLKAFHELRLYGTRLEESLYLSLLYKASREGRDEDVWNSYMEFVNDEKQGNVQVKRTARTTWQALTDVRMQMCRFALWAMLDMHREKAMKEFYQREIVGRYNHQGVHEADALNFLLRMECTNKVMEEQERELRLRVETLLNSLEKLKMHTSYSSAHSLVRLILHRPEFFVLASADKELSREDLKALGGTKGCAEATGEMIIEYFERFPCAMALDSKRISIAVSSAAAAGQHDAAKLLLKFGLRHCVPVDAGSFAHVVESAPDDTKRLKIAELYVHAKECGLVSRIEGLDSSIVNYLLHYAILDGNYKHMMELLHEMQLCRNLMSNRTLRELFKSIAQFRANIRGKGKQIDANQRLNECPTIKELFERFPNVIPCTVHSFSQGILQSLHGGDLSVALGLMHAAHRHQDVKLRPEIYSQLLYPLLAGGQRGGDELSDASVFERLRVERCFDKQYPKQRAHLNSLIVNICQSNNDFLTLLVCLDRWQAQGHQPMSRRVTMRVFEVISKQIQQVQDESQATLPQTVFVVKDMELSYLAFLMRYRTIVTWDAWTIERAIIRSRTSGLGADVAALLTEAHSCGMVVNSTAYVLSLHVLEELGQHSAIVNCVEKMKANKLWEKAIRKDAKVQAILTRAEEKL
ncbi:hypothetical protein CCR75_007175 [Bremia lactucae]|uniref:Uncharacterized protein n=1 Tax=Bremia lactucae TaxID=4779 RepID=A0A976FQF9_BRELC|nr:hypothetical protein CCR75_007175 [Bremia lactucae]